MSIDNFFSIILFIAVVQFLLIPMELLDISGVGCF